MALPVFAALCYQHLLFAGTIVAMGSSSLTWVHFLITIQSFINYSFMW
jgi:hypothetical protein